MEPPPAPTTTTTRLRLMCSYGGHISPRPQTKSLYYEGGDTRIITIQTPTPLTNLSLSSLLTHLSTTLHLSYPFNLKYQLPNHDLDSLISLSTDDDLLIMLDEHRLLSSSATPSRIRLFMFPSSPAGSGPGPECLSELKHPKRESFFVDALKGVVGYNSGEEGGNGGLCGAEAMVLETSSSFGSTSSSASLSHLGVKSLGVGEDHGGGLVDKRVKLLHSEVIPSDNSVGTTVCCPLTGNYQDLTGPVEAIETSKVSTNPFESESKLLDPSMGIEMHRGVQVSGFPMSLPLDQPQQVQFLPMGAACYVPHNQAGVILASSHYPMSAAMPYQQQLYYQSNQPQPLYYVPVGQPYSLAMQSGVVNTTTMPQNRHPLYPNTAVNAAQVAYEVTAAQSLSALGAQVYRADPMATPLIDVSHQENHEEAGGVDQVSHQAQPSCVASVETANYNKEHHDDPARIQIYRTQPPAPSLPSQCQTVTKTTTHLLSDALEQLHMDNTKQQLRTSRPQ